MQGVMLRASGGIKGDAKGETLVKQQWDLIKWIEEEDHKGILSHEVREAFAHMLCLPVLAFTYPRSEKLLRALLAPQVVSQQRNACTSHLPSLCAWATSCAGTATKALAATATGVASVWTCPATTTTRC